MRFTLNGKLYSIRFQHEANYLWDPPVTESGIHYGTTAFLEKASEDGRWLVEDIAFSYLHEGDVFCKETGRRVSLTRLTFRAYPDEKASRQVMWNAYWNRNVKPDEKEETVNG